MANYIKERSGVDIDDATLDKKLRTFFEDLITEILKNPAEWDRTRNINFMELYNYLEEQKEPEGQDIKPMGKQAAEADEEFFKGDKVKLLSDIDGMKGMVGTVVNVDRVGRTISVAFGDKKEYHNKGGWVSSVEYEPTIYYLERKDIDHIVGG